MTQSKKPIDKNDNTANVNDHVNDNLENEVESLQDQQIDEPSRPIRRQDDEQSAKTAAFVVEAGNHLADLHCTDVIILDVRGKSDLSDYLIIASGSSDRQIRSISHSLEPIAKEYNLEKFGRDIDNQASWVVTDFVEVIVHLFDPAARAHYDLEMMWGDAPRIDFRRKK